MEYADIALLGGILIRNNSEITSIDDFANLNSIGVLSRDFDSQGYSVIIEGNVGMV